MSTRKGSAAKGAPKHQNVVAWKPDRAVKKKESELGGKRNPYPPIVGVCQRCRDQIEWRRKYGKYKLLRESAKCVQCTKKNVRVPYMSLCPGCSKERNVCAKCCKAPDTPIISSEIDKEAEDMKRLEDALKSLRERERRTLLRAMSKGGDAKSLADKAEVLKEEKERRDLEGEEDFDEDEFGSSDESDGGDDVTSNGEVEKGLRDLQVGVEDDDSDNGGEESSEEGSDDESKDNK